jgi:osmotically-inducible protein OsmY
MGNKILVGITAAVVALIFAGILTLVVHYSGRSHKPAPAPQTVAAKAPDVPLDSDIQKNIEQQLETLKGSTIQVEVQEGVVTLTGKTPNKTDLVKAETLAAEVGGVKQVTNKVQVEAPKGKGKR